MRILRLARNTKGRDLVVGDIHGEILLLLQLLTQIGFDPERDRLFLVGDLIDRGPYSHLVLQLLALPSVYSVRGNHEDMLLGYYANGEPTEEALAYLTQHNGLGWWMHIPRDQRIPILQALAALPLVIEVDTPRGSVGLIHAEVPRGMDWPTFVAGIEAGAKKIIHSCLWGRTRVKANDASGVRGVGRIFAGHTPQLAGMRRLGNHYLVDTAAVYGASGGEPGGRLTVAHMLAATAPMMQPKGCDLPFIDIRGDAEIPENPFGQYARGYQPPSGVVGRMLHAMSR